MYVLWFTSMLEFLFTLSRSLILPLAPELWEPLPSHAAGPCRWKDMGLHVGVGTASEGQAGGEQGFSWFFPPWSFFRKFAFGKEARQPRARVLPSTLAGAGLPPSGTGAALSPSRTRVIKSQAIMCFVCYPSSLRRRPSLHRRFPSWFFPPLVVVWPCRVSYEGGRRESSIIGGPGAFHGGVAGPARNASGRRFESSRISLLFLFFLFVFSFPLSCLL